MTLSVMVREPGYQDERSDIGRWNCYLAAGITPLANNIDVDWLGIKVNYFSIEVFSFNNISETYSH